MSFPKPDPKSIIYQDSKLYVCAAAHPFAKDHLLVVWKKDVKDLHALSCKDFEFLMEIVDATRDTMLEVFKVKKVYLFYMDEARHVHWHLIPRYKAKGFSIVVGHKVPNSDFSRVPELKKIFQKMLKRHQALLR
ncbi:MAG: HIT domain-containing protein [Patescibacteria group bacterium]